MILLDFDVHESLKIYHRFRHLPFRRTSQLIVTFIRPVINFNKGLSFLILLLESKERPWIVPLEISYSLQVCSGYVYEAGALDHPGKGQTRVIDNDIVEDERKKKYEIKRIDRFRYRTRYFTDSGIIGTKEFVSSNYQRFKGVFMSKREKIPRRVAGLDGVYSLKRLTSWERGKVKGKRPKVKGYEVTKV